MENFKKNCPVCGENLSQDQTCDACGFFEVKPPAFNWATVFKITLLGIVFAAIVISVTFWVLSNRKTIVDGHYKLINDENSVVYVIIDDYPKWKDLSDNISALQNDIKRLSLEKKDKFSILEEERRIERLILNRKNELHSLIDDIRKLEKPEIERKGED